MIEHQGEEETHADYVRYQPTKSISDAKIRKTQLLGSFNRLSGEDYTRGRIGATTFEFSEVHLKREEKYRDKDSRQGNRERKVFSGVAFIADFHKEFKGRFI